MEAANADFDLISQYANPSVSQQIALVVAALLVLAAIVLSWHSNILRDQSHAEKRPFSLSRVQFMWWTVIIAVAVVLYCGIDSHGPAISGTCLVLLGLGTGTTLTARIIDDRQRDEAEKSGNVPLHQDANSRNFVQDILSDETGVSVHRFQAVVFNFVYGVSFLYTFAREGAFPAYDGYVLALLGISSAGYLGLKSLENRKPAVAGKSDEVLDVDVAATPVAVG
jgi:hypothetical protein